MAEEDKKLHSEQGEQAKSTENKDQKTDQVENSNPVVEKAEQNSKQRREDSRSSRTERGDTRPHRRVKRNRRDEEPVVKEFTETLVQLNRVVKVVKGGRRFSFSALVVVGNKKKQVGYGFGKAGDVAEAIRKAIDSAKREIVTVKTYKSTIPHWVIGKFDTSRVLLKPASPGTGIIAGGPVRIILEMAGYSDMLSKCMGSRNSVNVVKATFDGLSQILSAREISAIKGKSVKEIWN